ncbi:MAG: hypothetical protein Q9169_003507 [Polycauliona sp. 2 TL-2023]
MCVGSRKKYDKCGHEKRQTEWVCPAGQNADGTCVNGVFQIVVVINSTAPSLCVNCYQRTVDNIIAMSKMAIAGVDEELAKLVWERRAVTDDTKREKLDKELSCFVSHKGFGAMEVPGRVTGHLEGETRPRQSE